MEVLAAAHIPVIEDSDERLNKFKLSLRNARKQNRRAHYLYGLKDKSRPIPSLLPPLPYTYIKEFNPLDGFFTVESDRDIVQSLLVEIQSHLLPPEVGYHGDIEGDKWDGYGKLTQTTADGGVSTYEGFFIEGKRYGFGTCYFANGDYYEGDWIQDRKFGKGLFLYVNGSEYDGDFANDRKEGYGRQIYVNGSIYEGDWVKDLHHGKGKLTFCENYKMLWVYEGDFVEGRREGQGKISHIVAENNDSTVYEGGWLNNKKHGYGNITYDNGNIYRGNFVEDLKSGEGVMTYSNGSTYTGNWEKDMRHAKGIFRYPNGEIYDGEWFQNQKADSTKSAGAVVSVDSQDNCEEKKQSPHMTRLKASSDVSEAELDWKGNDVMAPSNTISPVTIVEEKKVEERRNTKPRLSISFFDDTNIYQKETKEENQPELDVINNPSLN
jgi:hypothetical protein